MSKDMTEMKWYVVQQQIRDKVLSTLAEMDILSDEDSSHLDKEGITDQAYDDVIMMQQRLNQFTADGAINEDYTRADFYLDMLTVQSIRLAATRHGWDIEMAPIYDEPDAGGE